MIGSHKRRTDDFEVAAMPHASDLYRTATRLLGDAARADDVVQEVYLHAWQSFEDFELGTNCRAWLFKILFHKLQHYRRKWMSLRVVEDSERILEHAEGYGPSIPEEITDGEILAALSKVPHDLAAVVLLVDVQDFSYKEAASVMNVPVGTIMSRLSRARKALRERLAGLRPAGRLAGKGWSA